MPIPRNERESRAFRIAIGEQLDRIYGADPRAFRRMILQFAMEHEDWLRQEYPNGELLQLLDEHRDNGLA